MQRPPGLDLETHAMVRRELWRQRLALGGEALRLLFNVWLLIALTHYAIKYW